MLTKKILLIAHICTLYFSLSGQTIDYLISGKSFKEAATALNVSPDGTKLLAGFQDGTFSMLDINTLEILVSVEGAHLKAVYAIEMSPKMDFILTAGFNTIKLWTPEGEQITKWKSHATTIWNLDISSNGKYAVSSEFNKTFRLWDVYKGEVIEEMRGHEDVTMAVAISPDSKLIASGSNDMTIKIWDIESHEVIKTLFGPAKEVYDVKFSPDGQIIAVGSNDNSVRLYNIEEEKMLHLLKGHRNFVTDVEFSPDGRYLLSASADQAIFLWDVATGERIYSYLDNQDALLDMAFCPDGSSFFSSSLDKKLNRWEIDPEIFVLKYFEKPYLEEISGNHLFDDRRQGEPRKDFESRMIRADKKRAEVIDRYYQQYLERFE